MSDLADLASKLFHADSDFHPKILPTEKRVRGVLNGEWIFDTTEALMVWEVKWFPSYWIPRKDMLPTAKLVDDQPISGIQSSTSKLYVGDKWVTTLLVPDSFNSPLAGYVKIEAKALDAWYEEQSQVLYHPKDPFHRVDILPSGRHVRVQALDGTVLADTSDQGGVRALFETNFPARWYLPRTAINWSYLRPSDTKTGCPYKGQASYYDAVIGDKVIKDVAWWYPNPIMESYEVTGLLCFYPDKVKTLVDGKDITKNGIKLPVIAKQDDADVDKDIIVTPQTNHDLVDLQKENLNPSVIDSNDPSMAQLLATLESTSISKSNINSTSMNSNHYPAQDQDQDQDQVMNSIDSSSPQDDLIEILSTPDRGLGVFARRKIKAGKLVLAERPLLRLSKEEENDSDAIECEFDNLSHADQKLYLQLFDAQKSRMTRVTSIYYSNCYNLDSFRPDGKGGSAVGAIASRFNHSCVPNLQLSFNFDKNLMMFYAIRDIPRGKEVCTNYEKNVFDAAVNRRRRLQMYYGFTCQCEACLGPAKNEFWAKSDQRRRAMFEAFKTIQECEKGYMASVVAADVKTEDSDPPTQSVNIAKEALAALVKLESLLVKEGLNGVVLTNTYRSLSKWSERLQDYPQAARWKEKEEINSLHGLGPHAFRTIECDKKIKELVKRADESGQY